MTGAQRRAPLDAGIHREDGLGASSLRDALDAYGLGLEPRKAPSEFLVVDSAEKVPTEN